jgi:hypothetical protein
MYGTLMKYLGTLSLHVSGKGCFSYTSVDPIRLIDIYLQDLIIIIIIIIIIIVIIMAGIMAKFIDNIPPTTIFLPLYGNF